MENSDAELISLERARDGRGRKLYSRAMRQKLLEDYENSGMTQAAFAKQEGIKYVTFSTWVKHRKTGQWPQTVRKMEFARVELPKSEARSGRLEVTLVDGTRIVGDTASVVAELLRELRK